MPISCKLNPQLSRRGFVKNITVAGAALGLSQYGFPAIVGNARPRLRLLGTHVTLQEAIRIKAENDLGIEIVMSPGGSAEVLHKATTQPESFDVYEQWSNSLKVLWDAEAIQGIDLAEIKHWNEVNDLTKTGRVAADAKLGAGDAPYKLLYIQPSGKLSNQPSEQLSFLPYVHNVDSFGYNSNIVEEGVPYKTESWSWLLDDRWHGRTAIVNAPTIGLFDLALAFQASGKLQFKDIGNMTRDEIDRLFEFILEYRKNGHFRGTWSSVPRSVDLMASGEVVIQSMFSPGVSTLRGMGIPCVYAAPREGYRAWHGVMCLSSAASGEGKEAAYRFMNWWLSGWPGAFIARQGYYISNPQRSKPLMTRDEWEYWYLGKPASVPLTGTDGKISVLPGQTRRGGSYTQRFSNIAVWNTVMDQYEYSLLKWNEFLLS